MIHDAQYDPSGTRMATASSDGKITIYDVTKLEKINPLISFDA